jgi:thioredoxin reductase
MELRELGRRQLLNYPSVALRENTEVVRVGRQGKQFCIEIGGGAKLVAPFVLLATGRIDLVPAKPGFRDFYGRGVYHCVHCDGWEHRDQKLIAYGSGEQGYDLALSLLCWSRQVTLCTDGPAQLTTKQKAKLRANQVEFFEDNVLTLHGNPNEMIRGISFEGRDDLPCDALFFCSDCLQKSNLAEELGCELDETGSVTCDEHAATGVPGLFVAGNVRGGVHLAIVAAAEGAEAAMAINTSLHEQRLK